MGKASAGAPPASSQETTDQILSAYATRIPEVLRATASQSVPLAQADLAAAQAVQPGYAGLQSQANELAAQQAIKQLTGSGAEVATAAKALQDKLDPTQALTATKTADLLNSINLNGLSGGERAEVERSLARSATATGNLGLDNATNAVTNAMSFGDRLSQKRAELNSFINTANSGNAQRSGTFNPIITAMTQGQVATPSSGNAFQFGQSALGNIASATGAQNALTSDYNWKNSTRYALSDIGRNA